MIPLKDVKIGLSQSKINVSSDGQIIFKDIIRDEATGILSASLWANSGLATSRILILS